MSAAEIFSFIGAGAGILGAVAVMVSAAIQKWGKSPEVQQSSIQYGISILEKSIERAGIESSRWLEVERYLRDELRKADSDKDRLEALLETAKEQIRTLQRERDQLLARLQLLVIKFRNGDQITLADITGQPDIDREIDELEDTLTNP